VDRESPNLIVRKIQELEKNVALMDHRLQRVEKDHAETKETRETFLLNVENRFETFRQNLKTDFLAPRDSLIQTLHSDMMAVQKKLWLAIGVIVTMQFLAPFILKFAKVF